VEEHRGELTPVLGEQAIPPPAPPYLRVSYPREQPRLLYPEGAILEEARGRSPEWVRPVLLRRATLLKTLNPVMGKEGEKMEPEDMGQAAISLK
jgi:hypothetical protein